MSTSRLISRALLPAQTQMARVWQTCASGTPLAIVLLQCC